MANATLRFSPASECLLVSGVSGTEVWHLPPVPNSNRVTLSGVTVAKIISDSMVLQAGFSPDGRWIYIALANNELRLWSRGGTEAAAFRGHRGQVNAAAFSPDGKHLVSASHDGTVLLWDVEASLGRMARAPGIGNHLKAVAADVRRAVISDASGVEDAPWQLWNEGTRSLTVIPRLLANPPSVLFSPDGNLLATAEGAEVWLRDAESGRIARDRARGDAELSIGANFNPVVLAFSGDGQWLTGAGGELVRWRVSDRTVAGPRQRGGHAPPAQVALNWNGDVTAVVRLDQTIEVWRSPQAAPTFLRNPVGVGSIAVDPGGELIPAGLRDGSIRLWRSDPKLPPVVLPGHTLQVNCLTRSRDGRLLASGGADGTVRLWSLDQKSRGAATANVKSLGMLRGFTDHQGQDPRWTIQAVAFGADGASLVAASGGGEVRWYTFPELAPATDTHRLATQRLTRSGSQEEVLRYALH